MRRPSSTQVNADIAAQEYNLPVGPRSSASVVEVNGKVNLLFFACLLFSSHQKIIIIMFCPTAVDAYFGKKLSHLDLTFSKTSSYQERVSFEERVKEAEDTRSRYPNKIPLVIEKHKADKYLQDIDKVATIRPVQ